MKRPIILRGLRDSVNGTYVLTAEKLNGKPVYANAGDADTWLFARKDGKWAGGATTNELTENSAKAGYDASEAGCAHPAAAKAWPDKVSIMVRSHSHTPLQFLSTSC